MSHRVLWAIFVLVAFVHPAIAATYYVGGCHSGSFPNISAAVNSSSVAAGSIVKVCPGVYAEQVIISKPLTLQGITSSGRDQVTIQSSYTPATTTSAVFGATSSGLNRTIVPVVWVTTGPVNIQNISVLRPRNVTCPALTVGFYYASGASGTLNHVATYADQTDQQLCGVGIWAENANIDPTTVTIQNSLSDAGIVAGSHQPPNVVPVLTVSITGNQIFLTDMACITGFSSIYGIYLYDLFATVSGNFITGPSYCPSLDGNGSAIIGAFPFRGIMNDRAGGTTITNNTFVFNNYRSASAGTSSASYGIVSNAGGLTIESNKISGVRYAISLSCSTFDTVSGNTISSADYGIQGVPFGFSGVNTFYNTFVKVRTC